MRRRAPAALLALLLPLAARAQAPSGNWRTIETAHFRVHYPADFEAWARRTTSSLESIHADVTAFVGYAPPRRVDVVVRDPEADANGMALPFLRHPTIVLWAYPPDVESSIGDSVEWMDLLTVHELAHIVHLTRPRNRPGLLERLVPLPIGPIPLAAPRWVTEGYATLVEGELTGSGRPHSSFRAMVLRRFALEGKLPSYSALSGLSGWLGGSMAYLVGSDYLAWLEAREGKESLRRLWKRMTSRRGGGFDASFRAVFGRPPADLYDRYRAERTASAIEEEKRREAAGLVEGELRQRLAGGTASIQVSPDGRKLLARRAPRRGEAFLAVWTAEPTAEEIASQGRRAEEEAKSREDPNEIADRLDPARPREPRWKLARQNGEAPQDPRWMPDSRGILFSRRTPDAEGVRRLDLFVWDVENGGVRRVTRGADVGDADVSPDGAFAVGVRNRYGISRLVRVDLATGTAREIETGGAGDPWRIWSHPRLSPDGRTIAAVLHERGEWRLVLLSASGGEPRDLQVGAVGPPAWSPDGSRVFFGSDASGVWEIAAVDAAGREARETLTRGTGGSFTPAPVPDGSALFFLEVAARGIGLRRLALPAEPVEALPRSDADFPILPPEVLETRSFAVADVPAPRPYDAFATQTIRSASGFTAGPSGNSWQAGAEGHDAIGRFDWQALAAFGNAAGPRGGSLQAGWRGFPVKLDLQIFSALEKPGSQRLVRRPDLDQERRGFFANATWGRPFDEGRVAAELGAGWTRVEELEARETFSRTVASTRLEGRWTRTRGGAGFSAGLEIAGAVGNTAGGSWRQFRTEGSVSGIVRPATLTLSGRFGDTGGDPTGFDVFRIGGAESAILPPGLDRNRVVSPAMPAALQSGSRLETYGAALSFRGLPLRIFAERLRAYDPGAPERPEFARVEGLELRLERLIPVELRPDDLSFYVGVARVRSESPRLTTTQGYGGLIYRP